MTEVVAYPLAELIAGESVNVRPRDEDVSELIASIRAHGLLQPLVGRVRADGRIEIVDGNRRLKALQAIDAEDDEADVTTIDQVHVVLRQDVEEADSFEVSLAANVLRKPLHPVAEFEAFASLAERGKTAEEIAGHFGISLRGVRQRMALGRLHPEVRKLWHEGKINGEAARAFTLVEPAEQLAYLGTAKEKWQLFANNVERAFKRDSVPADSARARFVGKEAYRQAGGTFVADLFVEEPDFADRPLLERLADEKLMAEAERIRDEEGWKDVVFGEEARDRYNWDRLRKPALPESDKPARRIEIETRLRAIAERRQEIEDAIDTFEGDEGEEPDEVRAMLQEDDDLAREQGELRDEHAVYDDERAAWLLLPEDQRAKAVALIEIEHSGSLKITRGYLKGQKPKPAPKPSSMPAPKPKVGAAGEETPEPARLSAALMDDLALTATRAAAHVLGREPRIALAAFVATAATWGTPLRLKNEGRGEGRDLPWPQRDHNTKITFATAFREALGWDSEALQLNAARAIAHTLDFTSKALAYHSYDSLKPETVTELRAALPAEAHRAALVQVFDPADYFSAAPKQEAIACIAECGDEPAKYDKLKKADLGAAAARLANAREWLPPLLRGEIFEAVLPATIVDEPEAPEIGPAEPESQESAAEAAQRIWQDQERRRLEALKTPAIRAELTGRGIKVPFSTSKNQMIDLALATAAQTEEAA